MKRILKIIIPVAILLFLIWTIISQWAGIENEIVAANPILLLTSFFLLVVTYVGGAFFWHSILKAVNFKTSFKQAFRVFIISNFGRFIPGVVLHYIARVYLTKGLGLGVGKGITAVLLEAYYTLGGAVIVSVLSLSIILKYVNLFWLLPVWLVFIGLVIFVLPSRIFLLLVMLPYLRKRIPAVSFKVSIKQHLFLLSLSVVLFLIYGLSFFLLSSAFFYNPLARILEITGLLSASWVIGFITPVAPGGLGVADLSFAYLLQPLYSFSLASFLVVSFRFCLFLAEGLTFLLVIKLFGLNVIDVKKKS